MKYKLNDLCEITSSKRIFANEYTKNGIPFYRGKEIIELSSGKKVSTTLYISVDKFNEIKNKFDIPKNGDILLTAVGTLGIPYYVRNETFYFKDGNLMWFKNFNKICIKKYIFYYFQSNKFKNLIMSKAIGSTQKAITIDSIKNIEIDIHDQLTQQHIVDTIGSIDDLIEKYEKIINKLVSSAKLFYKRNKSNNLALLGNLVNIYDNIRKPLSSNERKGNKTYPYYGATQIIDYVDDYIFDGEYILLAEDGSVINDDETPVIQFITGKNWVGNHAHVLNSNGILNLYSLYFILQTTNVKEAITGAVQLKINQENLKKININLPNDIDEYNNYSKEVMKNILDYNNKLSKLNKIKKIYLKKFFG